MVELINHGHCKSCGRAVKVGHDTCSQECTADWSQHTKKRARTALLFYAAAAFMILLLLGQLFQGGLFG